MSKILIYLKIYIIRLYQYFLSPLIGSRCRFLPSCSEYFIEALKSYGLIKGSYLGYKRILSCHPFKFLGGGDGLDLVPNKKDLTKEKLDG